MKTASIPREGERVGKIWIDPDGCLILSGHTLHIMGHMLKVVEVVDTGLVVRRKTQADYEHEESKPIAKVALWGTKKKSA